MNRDNNQKPMKLTKKLEKELMQVYDSYWDSYLNGDVPAISTLLDESYTQVGSAETEVFTNKKDAVQFLHDTIDQVTGKLEMRNRSTRLEKQNNFLLFHELCDIYALAEPEWIFYSKFRATTIMEEKKDGWKIIHQHSSFPDARTGEGENIAIDKIAEENQQLREAIKRRTIELENKNRELEIEASLERVRARAMAMQNSNELSELVDTVFKELTKLDFALSWCIINIIDESSLSNMVWAANPNIDKAPDSYHMKFEDYPFHDAMMRGYKERETKYIYVLEGIEKKVYDEYLFKETEFRKVPEEAQAASRAMEKYVCSFTFSNFGGLQTVGEEPLSDENLNILSRFGKVFDLTYTRFNDLKQAEAQAREAQIEAALERVRSRTMGMQKSEELKEVIQVVYEQFVRLNIHIEHTGFIMDYKARDDMHIWLADRHEVPSEVTIPYFDCAHWNSFNEAKEKGINFFANHLTFEEKNRFYQDLFKLIPGVPEETLEYYFGCPGLAISTVLLDNVGLYIENFSGIPYSDEENNTLMRFGKVFQQTYTRFLDLQKSEAQTRESQIEVALERVRSRTMGMQHSSELKEAADLLFQQVQALGVPAFSCGYNIWEKGEKECTAWMSDPNGGGINPAFKIPLTEDYNFIRFYDSKQKGEEFYVLEMRGERMQEHYQYLRKNISVFDETFKKVEAAGLTLPETQIHHLVNFDHGNVMFITLEPCPEAHNIFKRFGKVFQQTYTRFLDLQKAEAQAREAQIETALERVRSRGMAMHKSEELSETAEVLFEQINLLGKIPDRMSIGIINEESKNVEFWVTDQGGNQLSHEFFFSLDEPTSIVKIYNAWKERKDSFVVDLTGQKLQDWLQFVKENAQLPIDETKIIGRRVQQAAFFSQGFLLLTTHEPVADEIMNLLVRFAKVFDQTYRRFLDLQKAEAQAREAQIETSLERVRSRAMAIRKSDELDEVIQIIFQELGRLEIDLMECSIAAYDTNPKDLIYWSAGPIGSAQPSSVKLQYIDHPLLVDLFNDFESGVQYRSGEFSGEFLKTWWDRIFTETDFKYAPAAFIESWEKIKNIFYSQFAMKHGFLEFLGGAPLPDDKVQILKRFTNVVDLTYTRYDDVVKAEAQAREAQIEAALEKVRSRTMAMHKSEELSETATVFFEQMHSLGELPDRIGISIINDEEKFFELWVTNQDGTNLEHRYSATIEEPTSMAKIYAAWKAKKDYIIIDLQGQELKKWIKFVREEVKMTVDDKNIKGRRIHNAAFFSNGVLLCTTHEPVKDEVIKLLVRFAKVFDQTYRRFLDLQKAEAQAKEAQIEASLEKVRSRTMAMHKSYELAETASVLFEQFSSLGIVPKRCSIGIINSANQAADFWMTSSEGEVIRGANTVPMNEHQQLIDLYNSWEKEKKHHNFILKGKARAEWTDYLMNQVKIFIPEYQPEKINQSELLSEPAVFNCFFFAQGFIMLHTVEDLAQEDIPTLERFAGVFEQTYTRFLDLKKAEAQAREAQIEAALERVRSKTMAMHNSHDVGVTVVTLFDEVLKLGLDNSIRCGIGILEGTEHMETWSATSYPNGEVDLKMGILDMTIHPMLIGLKKAWKRGETGYSYEYIGNDVTRYYNALNNEPGYPFFVELDSLPEKEFHNSFFFSEGILFAFTLNPISEEAARVLNRFAGVFGQTYRRYLDLQKAEAQAREAQFEAALERVRTNAMAMQSSEDLSATVNVFFKELKTLGIAPIRCGVGQIDEETRTTSLTTTTSSQQGDSFEVIGKIKQTGHPVLDGIYEHWVLQKEYHPVLQGDDIKAYYSVMKPQMAFPDYPEDATQYGNLFYFKEGFVFAWTESKLIEDELQIFRRFTSVLSLTYRRYMDLKEAEARAREAEQQASLDRVRAEIASMRTTDDLQKITPLIWRELTTLGVPFFRCGIFIIDEPNAVAHAYLSTPLGKSLAAFHVKIDKTWLENAVNNWRKRKIYHEVWNREQFIAWTQTMMAQGFVENKEHFQAGKEAPETLSLQLLPFTQGMLYVGSKLPLSKEEIKIAEKLADDFGVAYSRYEDFQKLEAANHRKTAELEEARQLQLSMLPKELPKLPNLDIAVYMKTATEVGGDYYDFNVNPDGTLTVAIGDATGHGMKAGTIVSMIKALFASGGSRMDMKTFFNQSSDALKRIELGRLMMGFVMLKIKTNKLKFANAGMPPLFIYRKRLGKVEEIMIHAMPLGAIKDFPYEISELEISSGDTILLLSDGLPELKNERNQQYGYAQVKEKFKLAAEKSPDEIVEYLKNTASKWINGVEPDDDVTFVVIKVK